MTTKVYAVYSIPKSPEYRLEGLFESKESARSFIKAEKEKMNFSGSFCNTCNRQKIYDIQIEEILE